MRFVRLYYTYVLYFFKSRMEYRTSFILGILSNFYCYFITFITFGVIVKNFGSIDGWKYNEMCILYSLNLLGYAIAGMVFWGVLGIEKEIIEGRLDAYLTKPMGVIQQIVCKNFADTFIGQVIVAAVFFVIAIHNMQIEWSLVRIGFMLISILGSFLLHSGAMVFFGALSFWIKRSLPLADLLYFDFKNFIQYPISIFPKFIRFVLTFVLPWAICNYYPSLIILNKADTDYEYILGLFSPLIGGICFTLAIFVFRKGLNKYNGSGS